MPDEPEPLNPEQEPVPPPQALVPPTPPPFVNKDEVKRKQEHDVGNGAGIGCLVLIGSAVLGGAVGSTLSDVDNVVVSTIAAFLPLVFIIIDYGLAVWIAYRLRRPYMARGMFIMLGIAVGGPLLLAGICAEISNQGR